MLRMVFENQVDRFARLALTHQHGPAKSQKRARQAHYLACIRNERTRTTCALLKFARQRSNHGAVTASPPWGVQTACHVTASMLSLIGRTVPSHHRKLVTPAWKLLNPQA